MGPLDEQGIDRGPRDSKKELVGALGNPSASNKGCIGALQ